jgi:hypothetical protein
MKKIIFMAISLLLFCGFVGAQENQMIYSSGKAYLPDGLMPDVEVNLAVTVAWNDLDVSAGGTGRKIVEEAVFKVKKGDTEVEFVGVRIAPSFPRGEITVEASCKIGKEKFSNTAKANYSEALGGKLLNLKLKMNSTTK